MANATENYRETKPPHHTKEREGEREREREREREGATEIDVHCHIYLQYTAETLLPPPPPPKAHGPRPPAAVTPMKERRIVRMNWSGEAYGSDH